MHRRTVPIIASGLAVTVAGLAGAGAVSATGVDDGTEVPITGAALDQASAAALDHVGGGRVTETEVGDEEGFYEVEVTLDDGNQVDVHLDEDFSVVGSEADGPNDDD